MELCEAGRSVTQPDWPGWNTPCPSIATTHLRRPVGQWIECYPLCDKHMRELGDRNQLA